MTCKSAEANLLRVEHKVWTRLNNRGAQYGFFLGKMDSNLKYTEARKKSVLLLSKMLKSADQ